MNIKFHINQQLDLYLIILSWVVVGAFAPSIVAIIWSLLGFGLIIKSGNFTKILLAFITMLILSDSRVPMMSFAVTAKIGAIILLFGYIVLNLNRMKNQSNELFKIFLPFLFLGVCASFWSTDPQIAFQKSISYSLIFFVMPLLYKLAIEQDRELPAHLINYFTVILGIGLVTYLLPTDFATLAGRYRGLMGNPNGMGILLSVIGPLYLIIKRKYPNHFVDKNSDLLFISCFVLSLLMTGSRTSLFALMIFIIFVRLRYLSNAFMIMMFLIILIGYNYVLSSLPLIAEFFGLNEYLRIETLAEGSGRLIAWNFAWTKIQDVFFLGGGFGSTELTFKRALWELSILGHQGNAHNSYLTIWMDTGIVGLLLYIMALIRALIKGSKISAYALPFAFCVLFSANFESWMSASLNPFTSIFLISLTIILTPPLLEENEKISVAQKE